MKNQTRAIIINIAATPPPIAPPTTDPVFDLREEVLEDGSAVRVGASDDSDTGLKVAVGSVDDIDKAVVVVVAVVVASRSFHISIKWFRQNITVFQSTGTTDLQY